MNGARPSDFVLTSPGRLRLYSTTELLRLPPPTWLIKDILPAGALVGLYGAPGSFKSFVAMDMAMSVASGLAWKGMETSKGTGIYVAAEGGTGMSKRAWAWLIQNNVESSQLDMQWLTEGVKINNDADDIDLLLSRIEETERKPSIVVIDTLARCFDGDENTQEDMGRFIGGVDRLRHEFGATVLIVHHTRLDGDRERGNTAFRGAADTMISCTRHKKSDTVDVSCDKQKDAQEFLTRQLELKIIPVPSEPPDDSCVLIEPRNERDKWVLTQIQISAQAGIPFKDLKAQAKGAKISEAAFKRHLVSLRKSGEIVKENGIYYHKQYAPGSPANR